MNFNNSSIYNYNPIDFEYKLNNDNNGILLDEQNEFSIPKQGSQFDFGMLNQQATAIEENNLQANDMNMNELLLINNPQEALFPTTSTTTFGSNINEFSDLLFTDNQQQNNLDITRILQSQPETLNNNDIMLINNSTASLFNQQQQQQQFTQDIINNEGDIQFSSNEIEELDKLLMSDNKYQNYMNDININEVEEAVNKNKNLDDETKKIIEELFKGITEKSGDDNDIIDISKMMNQDQENSDNQNEEVLKTKKSVQSIYNSPPQTPLFNEIKTTSSPCSSSSSSSSSSSCSASNTPLCMFPEKEELMNCQVDDIKFQFSEENITKLAKNAPYEIDQKEMEIFEEQAQQKKGKGRPRKPKRFFCCPFKGCGKKFNREFNLKDHIRTHNKNRSKEFECPVCKECFYRAMELRRHYSSVHEEKKFTCNNCGKKFGRKDALRRHETDSCYFNYIKRNINITA